MGFSPDTVGLSGETVSGTFEEPRPDGCPHRGLDITSSQTPKPFQAGIYGVVIPPINTAFGTIAVRPFGDLSAIVQYLHCSTSKVGIGDSVAPWTVLGTTGETAPPGTGITGIHLHIQVILPGTPRHSCWDRNYVDPASWESHFSIAGTWATRVSGAGGVADTQITLNGDSLGSTGNVINIASFNNPPAVMRYKGSLAVVARSQNGGVVFGISNDGCDIISGPANSSCNNTTPPGTTATAILVAPDSMRLETLGSVFIFGRSRVGALAAESLVFSLPLFSGAGADRTTSTSTGP
jgi:hypothetical protein